MSYTKTQWNNDTAPAINATNLNKIEQGIYDNDSAITTINTNIGDLTDLETTANTDLVSAINEVNAKSEIDNTYGTSQTKGYSQEYSNNTFATKDVATTSANGLMSSTDKSKLDNININGMNIINKSSTISNTFQIPVNLSNAYMLGYVFDADGDIFEFHRAKSTGQLFIQTLVGSNTLTGSYDSTTNTLTFTLSRTSLFFGIYF